MIAIEADFNHLDGEGRLLLADLAVLETTPFAEIARSSERIVFVDSGEFVEGRIVEDKERGLRHIPTGASRGITEAAATRARSDAESWLPR
jgi:hypothetical protein